jgi:hypothetical protein
VLYPAVSCERVAAVLAHPSIHPTIHRIQSAVSSEFLWGLPYLAS